MYFEYWKFYNLTQFFTIVKILLICLQFVTLSEMTSKILTFWGFFKSSTRLTQPLFGYKLMSGCSRGIKQWDWRTKMTLKAVYGVIDSYQTDCKRKKPTVTKTKLRTWSFDPWECGSHVGNLRENLPAVKWEKKNKGSWTLRLELMWFWCSTLQKRSDIFSYC